MLSHWLHLTANPATSKQYSQGRTWEEAQKALSMGRQETTRRETEEASSHIDRMGENLRIDSSRRNNKQGRSPEPGNHANRRHRQEKCECKSSPPSLKAA